MAVRRAPRSWELELARQGHSASMPTSLRTRWTPRSAWSNGRTRGAGRGVQAGLTPPCGSAPLPGHRGPASAASDDDELSPSRTISSSCLRDVSAEIAAVSHLPFWLLPVGFIRGVPSSLGCKITGLGPTLLSHRDPNPPPGALAGPHGQNRRPDSKCGRKVWS